MINKYLKDANNQFPFMLYKLKSSTMKRYEGRFIVDLF